jgi:hypothetical protein
MIDRACLARLLSIPCEASVGRLLSADRSRWHAAQRFVSRAHSGVHLVKNTLRFVAIVLLASAAASDSVLGKDLSDHV